jgi:3-oxoacyl-[acyl-carrier-protein] synthase-3
VFPKNAVVTNFDLLKNHPESKDKPEALLQELAERIHRAYGFRSRHMIRKPWSQALPHDQEESSESLCAEAVGQILAKKPKYKPEAFLLGTTTTRRYTGSQATSVLGKFSLEAPAYELKAGCSTSLASLHLAFLLMHQYDRVLVACAETLSKVVHPDVRETWFGLGDGGAALALRRVKTGGDFCIEKQFYSTDGRYVDLYTTPGNLPPHPETLKRADFALVGDASELKDRAKVRYKEMIRKMLPKKELQSIQWIIPHQVNRLLTDEVVKETGISGEILWDSDQIGNIGGASVLYTLSKAIQEKRFRKGDRIFFMSVGGGLSFATQLWKKL